MGSTGVDDTPSNLYALSAFSYLAAMVSSNHALQFIPYPTQVLGKSCKPIPVMILGVLFGMKRYPLRKYGFVLMIVLGVACFLYKENKAAASSYFHFGWGEILLLLSLTMDGTTGAVQERIRARHTTKSHQMMFSMNLWSTLFLLIGIILTGEIVAFLIFVQKYPNILFDMVSFSIASALGQDALLTPVLHATLPYTYYNTDINLDQSSPQARYDPQNSKERKQASSWTVCRAQNANILVHMYG